MTISGKNTILIKNILVGQVWLASGQSNMDAPVTSCEDANTDIAKANYPAIRFFTVAKEGGSINPMADCNGHWAVCSPQSAAAFSAVAFYFGRDLYKQYKEPIGLIHSAWGATSVEAWTSMPALKSQPKCAALIKRCENLLKRYPTGKADYYAAMAQWQKEARELAEKTGKPIQQATPYDPLIPPNGASLLYNAMISPIVSYTIKGVIWYQGESNADRAKQYQTLFPLLITDWRKQWQEGEFPFLFVQLASYKVPSVWCDPLAWAELRYSQLKALDLPNTGMAVTIDIGDANNIHPKNKKEVGRRLALIALNKCYGQKIEYSGPMYKAMKIDNNKVILTFDHKNGCLVAKGGELRGFIISGANRKFVPGYASIQQMSFTRSGKGLFDANDNVVVVENPDIPNPVAVRYAWEDNPESANLCNDAGLPASPFKTDDWPWVTDNIE
jgi:sialate O-acetylesterase